MNFGGRFQWLFVVGVIGVDLLDLRHWFIGFPTGFLSSCGSSGDSAMLTLGGLVSIVNNVRWFQFKVVIFSEFVAEYFSYLWLKFQRFSLKFVEVVAISVRLNFDSWGFSTVNNVRWFLFIVVIFSGFVVGYFSYLWLKFQSFSLHFVEVVAISVRIIWCWRLAV